jgi:hypothetical protein
MRDGRSAMKIWSLNKVGAVAGVFNVQGSSWDRKLRKYVQHNSLPPTVTAELRPTDIGAGFTDLTEAQIQSRLQYQQQLQHQRKAAKADIPVDASIAGITRRSASLPPLTPLSASHPSSNSAATTDTTTEGVAFRPVGLISSASPTAAPKGRSFLSGKISVRLPLFGRKSDNNKQDGVEATGTTTAGTTEEFETSKQHQTPISPADMFVAWSAADRAMTVLEGRDASLKFNLKPRDWDVISFSHVYSVRATRSKFARAMGAIGRALRFGRGRGRGRAAVPVSTSTSGTTSGTTSTARQSEEAVSPDERDMLYFDEEPFSPLSLSTHSSSTVADDDDMELYLDGELDTPLSHESNSSLHTDDTDNNNAASAASSSKEIAWSPIGLLNMLNAGGAVEEVFPPHRPRTAEFLARGPGEFGVYTSLTPRKITVDGIQVTFAAESVLTARPASPVGAGQVQGTSTSTTNNLGSANGHLVRFTIADLSSSDAEKGKRIVDDHERLQDPHIGIRKISIYW